MLDFLRSFYAKRRDKWWVLLLALLALGSFFLLPHGPYREIRLNSPLPTPIFSLGEGEERWGLVIWWGCPGCKRFLTKARPGIESQAFQGGIDIYVYDRGEEDRNTTARFLCYLEEKGLKEAKTFFSFYLDGDRPKELGPDSPCWGRGLALSEESTRYFKGTGLSWTPALIRKGRILYPSEENYMAFLRFWGLGLNGR